MKIPVPQNEKERLAYLTTYNIVETEQDERLDELTKLAASIFDVPMVIITILDKSRQWFKSKYGLDLQETSREISFCQYTIMEEDVFEVPDATKDKRFKNNPLVLGDPGIRYYCGAPLISSDGYALGSLGLLDNKPRKFDKNQRRAMELLAKQVVDHFELNRDKLDLEKQKANLEEIVQDRTREIQTKLDEISRKDEKLKEVNMELTRFMYKASHDLRGPLKTIQGLTQLALVESNDEIARPYLLLLKNTQEKLDQTLDHLLTVVRIKNHEPALQPVNLQDFVTDVYKKALGIINDDRQIDFKCTVGEVQEVKTDVFLLEIALLQILLNSVQFNFSDNPKVTVTIFSQDQKTRIDIEDNGAGIPADEQAQVFDMFFKGRSTGSGLGLYIAKNAIQKLNGRILITSEKYKGTKVSVLFSEAYAHQHVL